MKKWDTKHKRYCCFLRKIACPTKANKCGLPASLGAPLCCLLVHVPTANMHKDDSEMSWLGWPKFCFSSQVVKHDKYITVMKPKLIPKYIPMKAGFPGADQLVYLMVVPLSRCACAQSFHIRRVATTVFVGSTPLP